jgi:phosphoserine phosphatase
VRSAALFDVDRTLVTVNTARLYVQWRLAEARLGQHKVSWLDYVRVSKVLVQYALGTL